MFTSYLSNKRLELVAAFLALLLPLLSQSQSAQQTKEVFRIGTGGTLGTYFPVGSLIAQGINTQQPNSDLAQSSSDKPLIVAQRSNGSVANVRDIADGLLESALVQADVAHLARMGDSASLLGVAETDIKAIASLYLESVHLVVAVESGIKHINDLKGKRVSIDEAGSGTQLDVRLIFDAFDIGETNIKPVYLKSGDAINRLRDGQLDAFFVVAGYPVTGITALIEEGLANFLAIDGAGSDKLVSQYSFFTRNTIPANIYSNNKPVNTLAVAALWVVDSGISDSMAYHITQGLWSNTTQELLQNGHPKGQEISLNSALVGLGIPLHPGAARYYQAQNIDTTHLPAN